MVGITSFGVYLPRLRLQRKAIAEANAWFQPGLAGSAKGERAMANWDEDAVTLAVEAARHALPAHDPLKDRAHVDAVYFASVSMPFAARQHAGIVASALTLSQDLSVLDAAASPRAATSALIAAFDAVAAGRLNSPLVVAGEKRKARAGSSDELVFGDGGAAIVLGRDNTIANLLACQSHTIDFVDHFRGDGREFDYVWEERWVRDEGYAKIVPLTVKRLLEKAGLRASDIAHFVLPCPFARLDQQIAKQCGIDPERLADNLAAQVGDTGTAHAPLLLASVLERAKPGDKILVAQFGYGCDALLFETTSKIANYVSAGPASAAMARGKPENNYQKYLAFNGLVEIEKGMRAEVDKRTALTVLHRKNDMLLGLVGGKCRVCGTAQFPRSRTCVNPNCNAVDSQDPYSFAEQTGTILSWSADFLTYTLSPPNHYGMITFAEGGRFMADIADVDQGQIDSGTKVKMMFRVKDRDDRRGFVRYFWKAVPS